VGVDPLQIEHDVETELAGLDALGAARPRPSKVLVGRPQFKFPKDFLLTEELAGRARVFGHEHGRGRPCVACQPVDHFADFPSVCLREADAAFDLLGCKRHQTLLDDVAGMIEIGRKCQNFR
jgi:hypothetical protein